MMGENKGERKGRNNERRREERGEKEEDWVAGYSRVWELSA